MYVFFVFLGSACTVYNVVWFENLFESVSIWLTIKFKPV
jgi:hypothetical protein